METPAKSLCDPAILPQRRKGEAPYLHHSPIALGQFEEDADYCTYRSRGTNDWLLILTVRGSGLMISQDNFCFRTTPGMVTLYQPDAFHDYGTAPVTGHWTLIYSHFQPRPHWQKWLEWPRAWAGLSVLRLDENTTGQVAESLRAGIEERDHAPFVREDLQRNRLEYCLLCCHSALSATGTGLSGLDPRIRKALRLLSEEPAEPFRVAELARRCGLSESRFAHLFREQTGQTPRQAWEEQKMRLARELLRYSSLSISEIAPRVGFDDPFYFSTRFRANTGMSPTQYRAEGAAYPG
jgi:AraC family transcriptional regulator of arabinose operon